jgi:hypothetical protein
MEKLNVQAVEAIQWRTSYKCIRDRVEDAYLGTHPLTLQATIAKTQHLVKNLAIQSCIGRLRHYQQCLSHPLKMGEIQKYYQGKTITTTKNMA